MMGSHALATCMTYVLSRAAISAVPAASRTVVPDT